MTLHDKLNNFKKHCTCFITPNDRELLDDIEKDLEVLEILKNKKVDLIQFSISKNVESYNKVIMLSSNYKGISRFSLTFKEFNKIKEWLENDK